MIVLKLWSDEHRRTPIDIFVYEPFPFEQELARSRCTWNFRLAFRPRW